MTQQHTPPTRRRLFIGAGAVSAVAAVTAVASASHTLNAPRTGSQTDLPKPERGGGYQLSEHNQRYYRSARV